MAISDELFMIALGCAINYFIVYRNNKFIGSIFFMALGLIGWSFSTGNIFTAVSLVMLMAGFISLLYAWINK